MSVLSSSVHLPSLFLPFFLQLQADNAKAAAEASQARLAQLQERCTAEEARLAALHVSGRLWGGLESNA